MGFAPLGRAGPSPRDIYLAVNKATIPAESGFFKHERRIEDTLAEIKRVQEEELPRIGARDVHELVKANEARSFALVAEAVYRCALERKESRLGHYREEFPYRDDIDWLKWSIIKGGREGMEVRFEPVPMEEYPIKLEKRSRIPAPVEFSWEKAKAARE